MSNVHPLHEDPDYGMNLDQHIAEVLHLAGIDSGSWDVRIIVRNGAPERLVADPVAPKLALDRVEMRSRRRVELTGQDLRSSEGT